MSDKILLQKLVITDKSKKRLEIELEETNKLVTILESQLEESELKINQLNKEKKNTNFLANIFHEDDFVNLAEARRIINNLEIIKKNSKERCETLLKKNGKHAEQIVLKTYNGSSLKK